MAKLQRKDLTPDQYKRANMLTATTITLVYANLLIMNFTSQITDTMHKIVCMVWYIVLYAITAFIAQKNITNRKAMLAMAIGFEISYAILVTTTTTPSLFLIFPLLVSITTYLNEVLYMYGAVGGLVMIIYKSILLRIGVFQTAALDDYRCINIAIMCIIICLFGGFKAIKLLIKFSNDETDAVKTLLDKQKEVADEVEDVTDTVATDFDTVLSDLERINATVSCTISSMDEIAKGSEQTANAASEQASMTSEIQTRLQSTSQIASDAKNTSDELKHTVDDGKVQSDELEKQSQIVDEYAGQISTTIQELVEHVAKVSTITTSILNISSQTNLLALNASIEAARAGEAGKGFAVVADEIRNLAEETKQSTEMITGIMNELTQVTDKAQSAVNKSVESIALQREKIKIVNESFAVVDNGIEDLSNGIDKMNDEVVAVLEANDRIVENVDTLAAISEEMSSNAIQSASDANQLATDMTKFTDIINRTSNKVSELKDITSADVVTDTEEDEE